MSRNPSGRVGKPVMYKGQLRARVSLYEYKAWVSMRNRCYNPNHNWYHRYGRRGITVCEQWDDFEVFLADMGPRPSPKYSLDREDNDLGYTPQNCRWATPQEQNDNRGNSIWLTHQGRTQTLTAWSRELGVKQVTLKARLAKGWPIEKVMAKRVRSWRKLYAYQGVSRTVQEWAEALGMPYRTLLARLEMYGWPVEKALTTPIRGRSAS